MAKTIKFNLICDNKPVRTIEDLQNNFSIEDVLAYYDNKILHRWLKVRGYTDELEKIYNITSEKPLEIIKEIIKIFKVLSDEKKVEESVYILEYLDGKKELLNIYVNEANKTNVIISDYKSGYCKLVNEILYNPNDVGKIKANIEILVTHYKWVLDLHYGELFWILREMSVLALMCLLMNETSRLYYLPFLGDFSYDIYSCLLLPDSPSAGQLLSDAPFYKNLLASDREGMYQEIYKLISSPDLEDKLGENLLSFAGDTNKYWHSLKQKGINYMIISMKSGNFVRSSGENDEKLAAEDVNGKFVILDGIDYESNYETDRLLYMEV